MRPLGFLCLLWSWDDAELSWVWLFSRLSFPFVSRFGREVVYLFRYMRTRRIAELFPVNHRLTLQSQNRNPSPSAMGLSMSISRKHSTTWTSKIGRVSVGSMRNRIVFLLCIGEVENCLSELSEPLRSYRREFPNTDCSPHEFVLVSPDNFSEYWN